jgi:hypothetical protein
VIALVIGILLLIPGIALIVGGGALLWVDRGDRTSGGFVLSASDHFTAPGYALSSDTLDLSTGARWLPISAALGDARIQVTGDVGQDVFIGIAPVQQARGYLAGVGHTVVSAIGADLTGADLTTVAGGAPAGLPGDQHFWVARASGTGRQQLTWTPSDGDWMLVVMNSDASAGVAVTARAGATVPALGSISWTVLGVGIAVTVVGVLLIVLAARRRPGPAQGYPPAAWGLPPGQIPTPRPGMASDVPDPARPVTPDGWRPPD